MVGQVVFYNGSYNNNRASMCCSLTHKGVYTQTFVNTREIVSGVRFLFICSKPPALLNCRTIITSSKNSATFPTRCAPSNPSSKNAGDKPSQQNAQQNQHPPPPTQENNQQNQQGDQQGPPQAVDRVRRSFFIY